VQPRLACAFRRRHASCSDLFVDFFSMIDFLCLSRRDNGEKGVKIFLYKVVAIGSKLV